MIISGVKSTRLLYGIVFVALLAGCENTPPRVETLGKIAQQIDVGLEEKSAPGKFRKKSPTNSFRP